MAWLAPWSAVLPSLAAFAVFGASAWACLLCFTSYEERLQICQIFAGLDSPDLGKCEEAFADAFKGLLDTEISEETIPCSPASSWGGVPGGRRREGPKRPGETERDEMQRWENGDMGSRDRRQRDDHLGDMVPGEAVFPQPLPPTARLRGEGPAARCLHPDDPLPPGDGHCPG